MSKEDQGIETALLFKEVYERHGIPCRDLIELMAAHKEVNQKLYPEPIRISNARKTEIGETWHEWRASQETGANYTQAEAAAANNIDTGNASERSYFYHVARNDPTVQVNRAKGATLTMRQLNGPANGSAAEHAGNE